MTTYKDTEIGEQEGGMKMKVWGENTGAYRHFLTYILIKKNHRTVMCYSLKQLQNYRKEKAIKISYKKLVSCA